MGGRWKVGNERKRMIRKEDEKKEMKEIVREGRKEGWKDREYGFEGARGSEISKKEENPSRSI